MIPLFSSSMRSRPDFLPLKGRKYKCYKKHSVTAEDSKSVSVTMDLGNLSRLAEHFAETSFEITRSLDTVSKHCQNHFKGIVAPQKISQVISQLD